MAINQLLMIEVIKAIIYGAHIIKGDDPQDATINARAYSTAIKEKYEAFAIPNEDLNAVTMAN